MSKKISVEIQIRYVPLPPEKQEAWKQAMQILFNLMLEVQKKQTENSNFEKIENHERADISTPE